MSDCYDYIVIGSGFGGSVSAMRLAEKGYRVLVLERGKRFRDEDFPETNNRFWKYLWLPVLRSFGILQLSFFRHVIAVHGAGVGGGSLGYANVLEEPSEHAFSEEGWRSLADWRERLRPHFETARRMLGVARNPKLTTSDFVMRDIAQAMGKGDTFRATDVGVFFGEPDKTVSDPFFGGEGPDRAGCIACGGCMVGCRHNAKNTLVKNYLWFAEKWGAEIRAECQVQDIIPLPAREADGARYRVAYQRSTAWLARTSYLRAQNVIVSAGALGTMRLLFRCRDETRSLPNLSPRLGDSVRTNSEVILGATSRDLAADYTQGVAIGSIFHADETTAVEPVHYPAGSELMRALAVPMFTAGHFLTALGKALVMQITRAREYPVRGWARRSTIVLVMQSRDTRIKMRWGRDLWTLWRRLLVTRRDEEKPLSNHLEIGERITVEFAQRTNGVPMGSFNESLLNTPLTAHLLGGVPFGRDADEGVIGLDAQVHNYPGLYVIDGSIMPANPGVNPSLTITALAEDMMSQIPSKNGALTYPFGTRLQAAQRLAQ